MNSSSHKTRVPQVSILRPGKPDRWCCLIGPALILLAAAAAVAPQLVRGPSCGHDFDFHLISWLDAANSWRHGIPYPHWTPSANFGAGEPRFVFYPPLTWMLGAALGFVLPWTLVPVALTFLLLACMGLATRALAREALEDGAATLAGCVAIFSGYALFTAYERSAFAELAGGLWIPLLLLFALRERGLGAGRISPLLMRRAFDGSTAPLALVLAGAWLSNPTVGVMSCYLLATVALAAALLAKSWAPALRALVAAPLGMALTGVYLLPVAGEQGWADLNQVNLSLSQTLENNWLFARHADPWLAFHDQVLHQASVIAVAMIAVAIGAVLICWLRGRLPGGRRWWLPLALIPAAVLVLQFPFSEPVWNLLPKLRYLQFPWRWLVTLEAPLGVFAAAAVWPRAVKAPWRRGAVAVASCVVFAGLAVAAGACFSQPCDDEDAVPGMLALYRSGAGVRGQGEYVPPRADNAKLAIGLPGACLVTDPAAKLGLAQKQEEPPEPDEDPLPPAWDQKQGSCDEFFPTLPARAMDHAEHIEVLAAPRYAGYLILRLRSYPAWRVAVNGRPIGGLPRRDDGLIAVPVPQGPIDLTVDWTTTPDVIAGRWLSALAALLLTGLWLLERKLRQPRLS